MKNFKYIIFLSFTLVALNVQAQSDTMVQHANSMFILSYNTSMPLGNTADFVGNYSWRGWGIEYRHMMSPNFSLGIASGQNLYHAAEEGTFTDIYNDITITGKRYDFVNSIPIYATAHYYLMPEGSKIRPFVGLGVGAAYYENRTEIGTVAFEEDAWAFALAPEIGVMMPLGKNVNLFVDAKYNYSFENSKIDAQSHMDFSFGLAWTY